MGLVLRATAVARFTHTKFSLNLQISKVCYLADSKISPWSLVVSSGSEKISFINEKPDKVLRTAHCRIHSGSNVWMQSIKEMNDFPREQN